MPSCVPVVCMPVALMSDKMGVELAEVLNMFSKTEIHLLSYHMLFSGCVFFFPGTDQLHRLNASLCQDPEVPDHLLDHFSVVMWQIAWLVMAEVAGDLCVKLFSCPAAMWEV